MNDPQAWHNAQASAWKIYEELPDDGRRRFDHLVDRIMNLKENLLGLALAEGSGVVCGECGGECCLRGKYHVSMLDLIICRMHAFEPLVPDFTIHPLCPYGSADGCCFTPRFRPLTCVVFNCDLIEERMAEHTRHQVILWELELREAVASVDVIASHRLTRAALLSCGS